MLFFKHNVPISQKLCFHVPKAMLLVCKSYAFEVQNLCFWRVKPMLLEGKTYAFGIWGVSN